MHTARHILEHCLAPNAELIRGRTVLLVTHHVSLCLPATAHLVELENGKLVRQGTPEELRRQGHLAYLIDCEDAPGNSSPNDQEAKARDGDVLGGTVSLYHAKPLIQPDAGKLVDAESRAEGRVSYKTYLLYVKAAGWWSWVLTFLLLVSWVPPPLDSNGRYFCWATVIRGEVDKCIRHLSCKTDTIIASYAAFRRQPTM
jgi:hypothetical protein